MTHRTIHLERRGFTVIISIIVIVTNMMGREIHEKERLYWYGGGFGLLELLNRLPSFLRLESDLSNRRTDCPSTGGAKVFNFHYVNQSAVSLYTSAFVLSIATLAGGSPLYARVFKWTTFIPRNWSTSFVRPIRARRD